MKILDQLLPASPIKQKWAAIAYTVIIAAVLTLVGIYGIGVYGIALFIFTPVFIGGGATLLYGRKNEISQKQAVKLGFTTLAIFTAVLLVFAIEGIICIFMAAPFALLLTWLGSKLAHSMVEKKAGNAPTVMALYILMIPTTAFIEKRSAPELTAVVTTIEINSSPEKVWENVIAFPQLKAPKEFLFKTGIAYPINARIDGAGVGAVRHCNFTTGSFVEPVTVWDKPKLLKFDVLEQPAPMKEISFWDIDAPHLHDYFVSKRGQFKLTALPNGRTLLAGTTWYYHNIKPVFYWQLWSNYIIHKIHTRVLMHIKENSEK
ncbi:hypothetical protein DBR40_16690 [Pedobacter sp. KBW01]|uniref:hypothetical protein n=1 Tax=Pedobacter sp. KBW01 TaxID=2153364 RepID=UPI000F598123|nr:hypothetical protein [Pedobacter sp. KBW01]RQO71443.1 hypothetical protein DBR40_16690 [Pedobacter sp. KBW01]